MAKVTIKLDSPIITTDKSISEITTDGLANTGEIALATDGIVGNVNGALRKYPNPIKTFYVEKFVTNGAAKWGFEPKDVKTNDVVMIKTATENLMFTVAEATNTKATLCAFTKNGGTRIVEGQKLGDMLIGFSHERVADYYSGKTYEYSLSEDLLLTGVTPFTEINNAEQCVPSYYIAVKNGKNYLKLNYGNDSLLPIGASYDGVYGCVFYFIINHKGQQKLVVFQVTKRSSDDQIITSLSFVDLGFSPFNLTIGKTTKQINGTADVSFSAEEITDKFNGALIQKLTTASTEAEIRKAFTEVNTKTVLFPTPGSIISKLDGNNKGIVVSLSEPDVTTLGRTITVYHGNDTYTIIVKSDFTKVLMPWSKISSKRNIYSGDIASLTSDLSEADIKGLLTPLAYQKYNIIYPIKPQTGDLMEEVPDDGESRFITITALRNQENPDEYTDIIIPYTGKDNRVNKIVLKNDLSSVQSSKETILENYRRRYDGKLLLALDTVKAETIENSISEAYSYSIEQIGIVFEARLPKVGDLITIDNSDVPVCDVLLDTDSVQHTRWFAKGKLYEVLVNTALTRVPEDPKVIYDTTSGTLRDLYISAGAVYNEQTGYYELNGLTDITEEEMRKIYLLYITNSSQSQHLVTWLTFPDDFRTNIAPRMIYVLDIQNSIIGNRALEVLVLSIYGLYIENLTATAHDPFPKLRRVVGDWVYVNNNPSKYNFDYGQPFQNCPLLEEIRMKGINKSHTFAVSPNLSKESVQCMITNANPPSGAAVGSITITLHPTAYARLKDDADIVAALEAKGGIVTLVSA